MTVKRLPSDNRPNWQVSPYRREFAKGAYVVNWLLGVPLAILAVVFVWATFPTAWPAYMMFFSVIGIAAIGQVISKSWMEKKDSRALDTMIFKMKPLAQECVGEYVPDLEQYLGDMGVVLRIINIDGVHIAPRSTDLQYMATRINVTVLNNQVTGAYVG